MPTHALTPEHLQLYSTRRLEREAAEGHASAEADAPADEQVRVWKRLARYELRRRRADVPLCAAD